ncbi:MAG: glycosyltransferase [Bacteroidia bacterium]|nr:glycosyltransferase [Bacteroidia bacterium]
MKVLHLPYNVASVASTSVRMLNKYGHEAQGVVIAANTITSTDDIISLKPYILKKNASGIKQRLQYIQTLYKLIKWADILHWYWNESVLPLQLDFRFKKLFNKPGVVEWLGSDIRILEIELQDNPYFKRANDHYGQTFKVTHYNDSYKVQKEFLENGFEPVVTTGMTSYLIPELFPKYYSLRQRILSDNFIPKFPDANNKRPLIIHSPSSPEFKGTEFILQAIDKLKPLYDFDFKLVIGMPHQQALELMQQCDIYIDQLILGCHGYAACEAMAFGKPVICFVKDSLLNEYPPSLPLVNANPDNIAHVLADLISDSQLRHDLGIKGRAYIDAFHDEKKLTDEMVCIYEDVMRKHALKKINAPS